METSPQYPECFTLTAKDLWRYQVYALMHFSMLSPNLKMLQIAPIIWLIWCFGKAAYEFVHLWIAARFAPLYLLYLIGAILFVFFNLVILYGITHFIMWLRVKHFTFRDFKCIPEMLGFYQGSKLRIIRRQEISSLANEVDYIYINAKDRYIIPKYAFATDLDAQAYYKYLYDWWQREALDPTGVWPPAPQSASETLP